MQNFSDRINLKTDLIEISKSICICYNLGDYISYKVITVGYEDFNYILETSNTKYEVKIFNKDRTYENCISYIQRIELAYNSGINFPKLYKMNESSLYILKIENVTYKICVFEYIEGDSFFDLGIIPSTEELKEIIRQMSIIHKIDIKLDFIYDEWTPTNFKYEFEEKKQYIDTKYYDRIEKIYYKLSKIDMEKLPHSFIHGDMITSNILKDKQGKIWIIDFSVSNYLPRIVDLIVSSCNLCFIPNSKKETEDKIKILLNEYQKYNKLVKYELEQFKTFFDLVNAMGLLQTSYQNGIGNNSKENEFWLNESVVGLQYNDEEFLKDLIFN